MTHLQQKRGYFRWTRAGMSRSLGYTYELSARRSRLPLHLCKPSKLAYCIRVTSTALHIRKYVMRYKPARTAQDSSTYSITYTPAIQYPSLHTSSTVQTTFMALYHLLLVTWSALSALTVAEAACNAAELSCFCTTTLQGTWKVDANVLRPLCRKTVSHGGIHGLLSDGILRIRGSPAEAYMLCSKSSRPSRSDSSVVSQRLFL